MEIQTIRTTENIAASEGDRRCCTINALSVSAGIPFEIAQQIGFMAGRKLNHGFHGTKLIPVARRYGVVARKLRFKRMTLQRFIKTYPVGKFYVENNRHAFAVINGVVNDWLENAAGCILVKAWEITSAGVNDRAIKIKQKKVLPKWNRLANQYLVRFIDADGDCYDVQIFDEKRHAFRSARASKKATVSITAVWVSNHDKQGLKETKKKIIYTRGRSLWLQKGGWL